MESTANYDYGKLRGKKNIYYPNGAFKQVENYYDGKLDGYVRSYYKKGNIYEENYYREGKLLRGKIYSEEGYLLTTSGYK